MKTLQNKIDFAVVFSVKHANPNGDPLNGNRPRTTLEGLGEVSDVCLKRKIRNRLMDMGKDIFVQSDDKRVDSYPSLKARADSCEELCKAEKEKNNEAYMRASCERWMDVRSFGQVFAFQGSNVSVGVRGPVSIHPAFSIQPIGVNESQITKSVNSVTKDKKSSDTMGTKNRVEFGIYAFYGSINTQLASKTGFSVEDADAIHEALKTIFENDCSSARPDGSMEVLKVFWWQHSCPSGQYSSAKVHRSVKIECNCENSQNITDYTVYAEELENLKPEVYEGV